MAKLSSYVDIVRMAGHVPRAFWTRAEDRFRLDPVVLGQLLAETGARAVLLANPGNPTGQIATRAELDGAMAACTAAGALLVLDESFSEIIADRQAWAASVTASHPNLVVINSFSKNHHLQGQRVAACLVPAAQNRIYVVASLFKAFRERFPDRLSAVTFGASDGGVAMGPVRSARDLERLGALAAGGQAFGTCPAPAPFAFGPVVLDDDTRLRHAEAFGPLVSLCAVPDRAAALAVAAQEEQALVCYLYGEVSPAELALLRFGSLGINSTRIQGAEVPTCGFGTAGIGREGGVWGLQEFQTTINERWGTRCARLSRHRMPLRPHLPWRWGRAAAAWSLSRARCRATL